MQEYVEKSCIWETKNLSTDADSSTDTKKVLLGRQNSPKNKLFFARRFYTLYEQKFSNLRPLLSITFPQGFRISKIFGHPTSGSGGKKTFKRYLKSEQTDRQTHGRTNRLIESIGPEGRCFENNGKKWSQI